MVYPGIFWILVFNAEIKCYLCSEEVWGSRSVGCFTNKRKQFLLRKIQMNGITASRAG